MAALTYVISAVIWITAIVFIFDIYRSFSRIKNIEEKMEKTEKDLMKKLDEICNSMKDLIRLSNFQN